MSERTKKILTSFGSILVLLLLLEGGFRLFYSDNILTFDVDPEVYWIPRPDQKMEGVTINALGLRGPEVDERAPGKLRVLVTGDSFTYGHGVKDADTYPAQLGALLEKEGARHPKDDRPVEVLNGGGPGWGVFQMERYLRRAIERLQPDVVIFTVTPIDIYRQPFGDAAEEQRYLQKQRRRKQIRDASRFLTFMARRVALVAQGHRAVPNELVGDAAQDKDSLWNKDQERIRKLVGDNAGKTKFVLVVLHDFSDEQEYVAEKGKALADSLSLPFVYPGAAFAGAAKKDYQLVGDAHPNPAGHAKVARAVADMLYTSGLVKR
jgi:lysophospholipase L1-like esterase